MKVMQFKVETGQKVLDMKVRYRSSSRSKSRSRSKSMVRSSSRSRSRSRRRSRSRSRSRSNRKNHLYMATQHIEKKKSFKPVQENARKASPSFLHLCL